MDEDKEIPEEERFDAQGNRNYTIATKEENIKGSTKEEKKINIINMLEKMSAFVTVKFRLYKEEKYVVFSLTIKKFVKILKSRIS